MAEALMPTVPCEFCETQVDLDQWEPHSKNCHQNPTNQTINKKRSLSPDSPQPSIPCEFCDALIQIDDWQNHSNQCAKDYRRQQFQQIDPSITTLIPCEFCNVPIDAQEFNSHTRECSEALRRHQEIVNREFGDQETNDLIPCQFCEELFAIGTIKEHQIECQQKQYTTVNTGALPDQILGAGGFPSTWDQTALQNLSRHFVMPNSAEYAFVLGKFHESLPSQTVIQIERIQNRRWYRQYDAHKDDFIERYSRSTEEWLFHGCRSDSIDSIVENCFNRSHATRCAVGQGIYFASQAATSLSYAQPDAQGLRHMFMARVLVGKTTGGNATTRVCPAGFDTTGGGGVFVTYHDAQAYGEYLITFR